MSVDIFDVSDDLIGDATDDRRVWTWLVEIRKRYLKATMTLVDDKSKVTLIKQRLGRIATDLQVTLSDAVLYMVLDGMKKWEKNNKDKIDQNEDWKRLVAISKEQERLAHENLLLDDLIPIYHARGNEGFLEFLEDNLGYTQDEVDQFWDAYDRRLDSMPWSRRALAWLEKTLSNSEHALSVAEIKQLAVDANILNEDHSNFGAFEKIAQRMGVTSKPSYGMWFMEKPTINKKWR